MYASARNRAHRVAMIISLIRGEPHMIDSAGIWIDHRKAFVVTLSEDGEDTKLILSRVEKHPQRAVTGDLNHFYDSVISAIRGYANVFLFGPGEAKHELHKRVVQMKVGDFVMAAEAADKMTDREIIAKVRDHFGLGAVRLHD
jgi:hypothetical protein